MFKELWEILKSIGRIIKMKINIYYLRTYRISRDIYWQIELKICNFFSLKYESLLEFFRKHPEYINIDRKRSKNEKRNMIGLVLMIISFLFWNNLLGLPMSKGQPLYFCVWEFGTYIGAGYYYIKVAKGFRGMFIKLHQIWHWHASIVYCFFYWLYRIYKSFQWIDFFNNKKPFAYIIKVCYSTLMYYKKDLDNFGFGIFHFTNIIDQLWRVYFHYHAWQLLILLFQFIVFCAFDIELF